MATTPPYRSSDAGALELLGRPAFTARLTRIGSQWRRWLTTLAVVALVSTFAAAFGTASAATRTGTTGSPEDLNRVAIPNFDPDTWKPTAELPLPPMESPITFKLKDEPSYWFDTELKDVEKTLHTRSLAAGEGPTTITFSIGEPHTSVGHTVSSLVWPEGAQNMPFTQPGAVTGEQSVNLVTPGLYAFYCKIHPYMLGAVVIDDPTTPGADFGPKLHWLDGTAIPSAADEVFKTVRSFFVITEPSNWQVYRTTETKWDRSSRPPRSSPTRPTALPTSSRTWTSTTTTRTKSPSPSNRWWRPPSPGSAPCTSTPSGRDRRARPSTGRSRPTTPRPGR